mgnify:CR=1 FL=1
MIDNGFIESSQFEVFDFNNKIGYGISGVIDGVKYYNDSIASSPTRTLAGLNAFDHPVILCQQPKKNNKLLVKTNKIEKTKYFEFVTLYKWFFW